MGDGRQTAGCGVATGLLAGVGGRAGCGGGTWQLDRARRQDSQEPQTLVSGVETLHLVDAVAGDLAGLWQSACVRLRKLALLNLPAAAPGRTVALITDFLPQAPNLSELQLDFQFFDPSAWDLEALEALVGKVQAAPSKVSKLMLDWCRLGDAGVECVCRAVSRHARDVGESGASAASRSISPSASAVDRAADDAGITELSLAHCELRSVDSICDMLETPGVALTKLDLSSNALDDRQAVRLAQALPCSKLKELRLRDSQISVPLPVKTEWFWGC